MTIIQGVIGAATTTITSLWSRRTTSHYNDKAAEASQGFWNCPCVPMRERKECHCMPILMPDNDFSGQEQIILINYY
ncbi:hypothetical protein GIB67_015734 [Kingdonia uniflora]|uniref:Ferredoxin-thioredoxin reductase catalytic chain, chloroplastic n=1 Tax=Kingdonia uniflora TaxID=39325 RepID=A0A7J7NUX4_9MAGN|nr:hypothetical protein GIB67_015734 [Kingdonia uniflora]